MADLLPERIDRARGSGSQMGFELREGHLNWVQVWAIGRQEQNPCASCLDRRLSRGAFVGGEIVHDDDVAFVEGWSQFFLDISLEDVPVHRGIDDKGRGEPVAAQARDESLRHPMSEWRLRSQSLPFETAAAQTCQLGGGPGLVDKNQAMRFKPHSWLALIDPGLAGFLDVWPVLFACQ